MRYLMVLFLLCCVGCSFFAQAAYVDADGVLHQATPGVIDDIISGLTVASPFAPYAGLAASVLAVVGGVGTVLTRKGRKGDAEETVKLIAKIKENVVKLTNEDEVVEFVNKNIPKDKAYGRILQAAYDHLKKNNDVS